MKARQSKTYKANRDWSVKVWVKHDRWTMVARCGNWCKDEYNIPIADYPQPIIPGLSNPGWKRLQWMRTVLDQQQTLPPSDECSYDIWLNNLAEAAIKGIDELLQEQSK